MENDFEVLDLIECFDDGSQGLREILSFTITPGNVIEASHERSKPSCDTTGFGIAQSTTATETKLTYEKHSVIVDFLLSEIPRSPNINFMDNLYHHILADTFYQLLHNNNLSVSVRDVAKRILDDYLENDNVIQLKAIDNLSPFRNKFKKYITDNVYGGLEELFFEVISRISAADPKFSFVYLIDELDALEQFHQAIQETRLLFKQLIRKASTDFQSKIRILIYLVGTSNSVDSFIAGDSVINSLVGKSVINLQDLRNWHIAITSY